MRKLFGIMALSFAVSAQAQGWNFSEISGKDGVVGYIYHSSAVGTQIGTKSEKSVTGLRFVCSIANDPAAGPALVIFWDGMFGNNVTNVDIRVDGKTVRNLTNPGVWVQDGPILFRNISESKELVDALKVGRTVTFSWVGSDSVTRRTGFNLRGFTQNLPRFNRSCKTNL